MTTRLAAALVMLVVLLSLSPAPDQCDQPTFARANPGLCYSGFPFPQPIGGGGRQQGGGGGGGLIGRVLHAVGSLL